MEPQERAAHSGALAHETGHEGEQDHVKRLYEQGAAEETANPRADDAG